MCYSTKPANIVNDGEKYRKYVERIHTIRMYELDHFLDQPNRYGFADAKNLETVDLAD